MKRSKSFSIQKHKAVSQPKLKQTQQKDELRQTHSKKQVSVPQAISQHIAKHTDVQIVVFYQQYKQQFLLKSKRLQQYLYKNPQIRQKYLSEDNPHFKYAFQYLLLKLYRQGVIVPNSYDNLRMEAVIELQNWTLSWIQRKMVYQKKVQEEKEQIMRVNQVGKEIQEFIKVVEVEELPF